VLTSLPPKLPPSFKTFIKVKPFCTSCLIAGSFYNGPTKKTAGRLSRSSRNPFPVSSVKSAVRNLANQNRLMPQALKLLMASFSFFMNVYALLWRLLRLAHFTSFFSCALPALSKRRNVSVRCFSINEAQDVLNKTAISIHYFLINS